MDFSISPEMQHMVETVREFMRREAYSLEREFLHASFVELLPTLKEKRAMVKKAVLWAPQIPEQFGGQGLRLLEFARISEALGRSPLGHYLSNCQAPDAGNAV